MRIEIGKSFTAGLQQWAKNNPHYARLAELDALLDGKFYNCLPNSFYNDTDDRGDYIPLKRRRPSWRFNLFAMVANQLARKTFAGRHAPMLMHPKEEIKKKLDAIKEECKLEAKMVEASYWGSIGSVATVFQIVSFSDGVKKRSKVVVTNYRARMCTPLFDKLDELVRLRIHYTVMGAEYLNAEPRIERDYAGDPIKGDSSYWCIIDFDKQKETQYKPIPELKWSPHEGKTNQFIAEEEITHGLGFVPAHWHRFRSGDERAYDGMCFWEPAVDNIVEVDYTASIIGSGIRYNAVPQVIAKGEIVNLQQDGALGRGANRFIQIKADYKDPETEESGSDVKMLEATGKAMEIGLVHYVKLTIQIAMKQICASLKDPDKLTTAMSGKGMEVLESEFLDLSQEWRTAFGDEGYLKLLKKIVCACISKRHALAEGVTTEDADATTLGWPPLSPLEMSEVQAMAEGLSKLGGGTKEAPVKILEVEELRDIALANLDRPVHSANRDYLPSVQASSESPEEHVTQKPEEDDLEAQLKNAAKDLQKSAMEMISRGPLDTTSPI